MVADGKNTGSNMWINLVSVRECRGKEEHGKEGRGRKEGRKEEEERKKEERKGASPVAIPSARLASASPVAIPSGLVVLAQDDKARDVAQPVTIFRVDDCMEEWAQSSWAKTTRTCRPRRHRLHPIFGKNKNRVIFSD